MNFLGNYRTKTLSGLERKRWQRRHQIKSLNAHVHDATDQIEDVARPPMLSAPVVRIVSDLRIPVDCHGVAFHDPFDGRLAVLIKNRRERCQHFSPTFHVRTRFQLSPKE